MRNISNKDKERLSEIANMLSKIKSESKKDELVGAAKWAVVSGEQYHGQAG